MIKKLVTIAALAMLLGSPASYADFITGNKLVRYCEGWEEDTATFQKGVCGGYVVGVFDANPGNRLCSPTNVTVDVEIGQVVSIVRKYLKENPERLHNTAAVLVTAALAEAFPCSD